MIAAFYFRVGPTGGPFEVVTAPPRRYVILRPDLVEPDRGSTVPADLDPCGVEHACNLCGTRVLEPDADLQDEDWTQQIAQVWSQSHEIDTWWPWSEAPPRERAEASSAGAELVEQFGQLELCPACYERHGSPDDWPDELLDQVYGPEDGPLRCYPDAPAT